MNEPQAHVVAPTELFAIRRISDGALMSIDAEGDEKWVYPSTWNDQNIVTRKGEEVVCIANPTGLGTTNKDKGDSNGQ